MRALALALVLPLAAGAQETTVAAPVAGVANYDPTLSAKEAVLANWDLAASGIRAGEVLGARVVAQADRSISYRRLARMAAKAEATMAQRWNAAQWVYAGAPGLARIEPGALKAAALAAAAPCEGDCADETAALRAAFAAATDEMGAVAAAARAEIEARMGSGDAALMAEQLRTVADYLEGGAWAEGLTLADLGRDREQVAARLVGAVAIWRNVEPYVGLVSPEIDDAINAASEGLLRQLRLGERQPGALTADGPELTALRVRAEALADEFRRAAALFVA